MFTDGNDISFLDQTGSFLDVSQPWEVICRHLKEQKKTLLIRGKPRTGKTTLGKAAEKGKVNDVLEKFGFTKVVYCSMSEASIRSLLENEKKSTLLALANFFEENKVIVFFDEAHRAFGARHNSLEFDAVDVFVKQSTGYAVFATTGSARELKVENTTPDELVSDQFFYRRPTSRQRIASWLEQRIGSWKGVPDTVEFLMDISDGDIGFLQFIGTKLVEYMAKCGKTALSFSEVRELIAEGMKKDGFISECRHLGLYNGGTEDEGVQEIVRQLLCCGELQDVDPTDKAVRTALTNGFASLSVETDDTTTLELLSGSKLPLGFTHPLQHELYKVRIHHARQSSSWNQLKDESEFVNLPYQANILSLICVWLPQMSLADTISNIRRGNLDPPEVLFQFAFKTSLLAHADAVVQEVAPTTSAGSGYLDFTVNVENKKFGVELLVRKDQSGNYIMSANTRSSFEEHFRRPAVVDGKRAYADRAGECDGGYCTMLIATTRDAETAADEVKAFNEMIKDLKSTNDSALKFHIILAIASRGWGTFTIVAWSPNDEKVLQFSLRRNGVPHYFDSESQQPLPAREFDPSARNRSGKRKQEDDDEKEYYVQASDKKTSAFPVPIPTSKKQDIAHLKKAIKPSWEPIEQAQITIIDPDTQKPVEKQSTPLKANSEENPYLFLLPAE